jgi:hypothetical protein
MNSLNDMNDWNASCLVFWIASILIAVSAFRPRNKGAANNHEWRTISLLLLEISAIGFVYDSAYFLLFSTIILSFLATGVYLQTENRRWINFVVYPIFILLTIENLILVIMKIS